MGKVTEKQLIARDAKRDLGVELLQAVREMKAGKGVRVAVQARKGHQGKNPHVGESFDTFLKEEGIYETARRAARRRLAATASANSEQPVTARRRRPMTKDYDLSRGRRGAMPNTRGKRRLSIYIDDATLERLKAESERTGKGYQTLINEALAQSAEGDRPVTASQFRTIVREELAHRARSLAPPKAKTVPASIHTKIAAGRR